MSRDSGGAPVGQTGERPSPWPKNPTVADVYERAWGLLANVNGGDLTTQSPGWQEALRWFHNDLCVAFAERTPAAPVADAGSKPSWAYEPGPGKRVEFWNAPDDVPCPDCGSTERSGRGHRLHTRNCPKQYGKVVADAGRQDADAEWTTLAEVPPGLFEDERGTLGFRSEYAMDAYCVESGEFYWGGVTTHTDRNALRVRPILAARLRTEPPAAEPSGHLECGCLVGKTFRIPCSRHPESGFGIAPMADNLRASQPVAAAPASAPCCKGCGGPLGDWELQNGKSRHAGCYIAGERERLILALNTVVQAYDASQAADIGAPVAVAETAGREDAVIEILHDHWPKEAARYLRCVAEDIIAALAAPAPAAAPPATKRSDFDVPQEVLDALFDAEGNLKPPAPLSGAGPVQHTTRE